jgi:hypothetical protein
VADAQPGRRNQVLYWAARCALTEGHGDALLDQLRDAAAGTGLDEREIDRTVDSARRAHFGGVAHAQ